MPAPPLPGPRNRLRSRFKHRVTLPILLLDEPVRGRPINPERREECPYGVLRRSVGSATPCLPTIGYPRQHIGLYAMDGTATDSVRSNL